MMFMGHSILEKGKTKLYFTHISDREQGDIKTYEIRLELNYQCIKFPAGKIDKQLFGLLINF